MGEKSHCGVGTIDRIYEREQAGVVRGHFFKEYGSTGCVECVFPVEGDDEGVGRGGREGRVDCVSIVVCDPGDADPQMPRVGQVSAYVGLLLEAYCCAGTQPCFRDAEFSFSVGTQKRVHAVP